MFTTAFSSPLTVKAHLPRSVQSGGRAYPLTSPLQTGCRCNPGDGVGFFPSRECILQKESQKAGGKIYIPIIREHLDSQRLTSSCPLLCDSGYWCTRPSESLRVLEVAYKICPSLEGGPTSKPASKWTGMSYMFRNLQCQKRSDKWLHLATAQTTLSSKII